MTLVLVALHVAYALSSDISAGDAAFAWISPTLLVVGTAYSIRWVLTDDAAGRHTLRLMGWVAAGAAVLGGAGASLVYYQHLEGGQLVNAAYTVLSWYTGGTAVGLVVGWYDVDRQRAADEAIVARDRTETLNRRLSVLNRILRHDIRTEVNIIHGNAGLLLDDYAGDERLETIRRRAERVAHLSENASRVERILDPADAAITSLDASAPLRDHLADVERRHPDATVRARLPDELRVVAHPLIDAAFANLLENAVEHNPGPSPRVEVWATREEETVTIHVADDGPGIPPNELSIIEAGEETPLEHSTGVGLWLVSWIVDESDGRVAFRENDPTGSVVSVTLAAAGTADAPDHDRGRGYAALARLLDSDRTTARETDRTNSTTAPDVAVGGGRVVGSGG